jgi:hypothetical protein
MSISLDKVVPWGRTLGEYVRMFDLSEAELSLKTLDCAGGPASFNAEMRHRGHAVTSCDPIYQFSASEIAKRIEEAYQALVEGARQAQDHFVWRDIESPDALGKLRMEAMNLFLEDFQAGCAEGRYRAGELPVLPFRDGEFELALCSHFLFTYSNLLSPEFHIDSIRELCRVGKEVRIFPLVPHFSAEPTPYLQDVVREFNSEGWMCEVRTVPYEFQKGGNAMLCVSKR